MKTSPRRLDRQQLIRALYDEYIEMYAARDDRLSARFSANFSGYTGGGDFLVKDRDQGRVGEDHQTGLLTSDRPHPH